MASKRNGNNRSRPKGKTGERNAKKFLEMHGWHIADTETQGLAGDDIFAQAPSGRWYSVEVKNTNACTAPKFIGQAKAQAATRYNNIQRVMSEGGRRAELFQYQGIDSFTKNSWMVMWHPSNCNSSSEEWVCAFSGFGGRTAWGNFHDCSHC